MEWRFLVAVLLALAGCVASIPDDPTISADIAAEAARAVMLLRIDDAKPEPGPKPGSKCPNCDGRGYVGDGTVRVSCQPCGGTGKVK